MTQSGHRPVRPFQFARSSLGYRPGGQVDVWAVCFNGSHEFFPHPARSMDRFDCFGFCTCLGIFRDPAGRYAFRRAPGVTWSRRPRCRICTYPNLQLSGSRRTLPRVDGPFPFRIADVQGFPPGCTPNKVCRQEDRCSGRLPRACTYFLLDHGNEIFPGTPIIFCGIDRREFGNRSLPPHISGILLRRTFAPTVDIALGLHPQTARVAVVTGSSDFDSLLLEQARQEFRAYEDRLAFTYLTNLPLEKLLAELRQLPPHTVVLFTTIFKDGAGASFIPHNVLPLVSAAANAPVYGFLDQ